MSDQLGVARDRTIWSTVLKLCADRGVRIVLIDVPAGEALPNLDAALNAGVMGVAIRHERLRHPSARLDTIQAARAGRARLVVASCGARSPREVLLALDAGADLVMLDTGLIEAGPGLAKRANEALAARLPSRDPATPAWRSGWPWSLLLGAGMAVAGVVVMAVGVTRVMLPYDEAFLGVTAGRLGDINPRLLGFMRHDRITLAATLMSIGILYASLAWNGMRRGQLWARRALLASGVVGFASLFLFLGFRYVDPLHVALSAGLFPLFLLGMILSTRPRSVLSRDLDNDRAWYLGLVGQLLLLGWGQHCWWPASPSPPWPSLRCSCSRICSICKRLPVRSRPRTRTVAPDRARPRRIWRRAGFGWGGHARPCALGLPAGRALGVVDAAGQRAGGLPGWTGCPPGGGLSRDRPSPSTPRRRRRIRARSGLRASVFGPRRGPGYWRTLKQEKTGRACYDFAEPVEGTRVR